MNAVTPAATAAPARPVVLGRAALATRVGAAAAAPAPVRIVHLGLGAFHRAHQAWYTAHATDAAGWGIAAFTGRDPHAAEVLAAQDGLYTLVERSDAGDRVEVVTSIVEAHDGADVAPLAELVASDQVAIVTLTITEAGYRLRHDGTAELDDPDVAADLALLRAAAGALTGARPRTALGRLLVALDARRASGGAPIAVVSCDNMPDNGERLRRGIRSLAALVSEPLLHWIDGSVSFVSTSVDRITPRLESVDIPAVRAAGWIDVAPVVTEPFRDWVLSGDFPAGRPDWASAGARFVDDIEPWEFRKLWLLNGAHSILAYAGMRRGHATVAQAIADPECRSLVERFHDEAVAVLPAGVEHDDYRAQLIARFSNAAIAHRLDQIAADGADKMRYRIAAVAERSVAAGGSFHASAAALATWIGWVLAGGAAPEARAADVRRAAAASDPVEALVALVSPTLAAHPAFVAAVRERVAAVAVAAADRSTPADPGTLHEPVPS